MAVISPAPAEPGLRNRQPADDYDRFSDAVLGPWDRLFLDRAEALRPHGTGLLADIGAGTGVVLERLRARSAFDGWELVGLEPFDDMVAAGQARFDAHGIAARMQKGDAAALPFADGTLGMTLSRATIHHLPDKVAALREMVRVLRPGGIALIHDARRDMPAALRERFNAMRAGIGYGPTTLHEKLTPSEMAALLEAAGLAAQATLSAGDTGLSAIGFEVVIRAEAP
jgi:SAM-dependent methyltransferase